MIRYLLEICKQFSHNLVNVEGNIVRRGPVPRFSDLEVVALSLAAESESIDRRIGFLSTNFKNTITKIGNGSAVWKYPTADILIHDTASVCKIDSYFSFLGDMAHSLPL